MKVREIYVRANLTIEAGESIRDAAIRMNNHAIGSLAVYRDGVMVGILTERDLVRALAETSDPGTSAVEDYTTAGVATVTPDTDIDEAAQLMVDVGARHLPVVDDSGQMMGMLSARDLVTVIAASAVRG
ncbi:MAG: CBS domain-containing protein [Actinomycetota bacterium]